MGTLRYDIRPSAPNSRAAQVDIDHVPAQTKEFSMNARLPLLGVRIHLSGSLPDGASSEEAARITEFVSVFARTIFREGATLVHGSHPTFEKPLADAAKSFVAAGGARDALILARAATFAETDAQFAEIERQREYAAVQIVPINAGKPEENLHLMRQWMAERCDLMVSVGGRWYDTNKRRAGIPIELEQCLSLGKPAFVVAGLGGAASAYAKDNPTLYSRLRNGLPTERNRALGQSVDVTELVDAIVSQIALLPLVRTSVESGRLFRVLALDGGGIRGAFTAAVLAKWDDMLKAGGGNRLVDHFDLVAGTSTGAILAIGLGLGLTPAEILAFYRKKGPVIFPKDRKLRHWLKSKYQSDTVRETLQAIFGDRKLSVDSRCRLVIPTVRAVHGESEAIVTAHSPDRTAYASITAVEAALASAAAPTYFDYANVVTPLTIESYLDGGIWANNPVLPAIAEAVRYLDVPLHRIDVLSVGTMGNEADFTESLNKGKAGWAASSADLFFAAQEHAAASLADSLLSPARHLRVNQKTPSEIKLDDVEAVEDMAHRGAVVGKDTFAAVRSRFLDGFYVPDWRTKT